MVKHLRGFREVEFRFRIPSGPRSQEAGIRITYTPWPELVIESKVNWPSSDNYEAVVIDVIRQFVLEATSKDFSGKFVIEEIMCDEINSSQYAFKVATRQAVRAIFELGSRDEPTLDS